MTLILWLIFCTISTCKCFFTTIGDNLVLILVILRVFATFQIFYIFNSFTKNFISSNSFEIKDKKEVYLLWNLFPQIHFMGSNEPHVSWDTCHGYGLNFLIIRSHQNVLCYCKPTCEVSTQLKKISWCLCSGNAACTKFPTFFHQFFLEWNCYIMSPMNPIMHIHCHYFMLLSFWILYLGCIISIYWLQLEIMNIFTSYHNDIIILGNIVGIIITLVLLHDNISKHFLYGPSFCMISQEFLVVVSYVSDGVATRFVSKWLQVTESDEINMTVPRAW